MRNHNGVTIKKFLRRNRWRALLGAWCLLLAFVVLLAGNSFAKYFSSYEEKKGASVATISCDLTSDTFPIFNLKDVNVNTTNDWYVTRFSFTVTNNSKLPYTYTLALKVSDTNGDFNSVQTSQTAQFTAPVERCAALYNGEGEDDGGFAIITTLANADGARYFLNTNKFTTGTAYYQIGETQKTVTSSTPQQITYTEESLAVGESKNYSVLIFMQLSGSAGFTHSYYMLYSIDYQQTNG